MARRIQRNGVSVRTYASGNKAIQICFAYRGQTCREIVSGNPKKAADIKFAQNMYSSIKHEISRGTFNYAHYFPDSKKAIIFGHAKPRWTCGQAYDDWMADIERSKELSTIRSYKKAWRFWADRISDMQLSDLSAPIIRDELRSKPMALKTMRGKLIPIRAIVKRALVDQLIDHDPLAGIQPADLVARSARSTYEPDPFTMDEITAIIETCADHMPDWLNYFVFELFTGKRPSEGYGLMWPDIDLHGRTMTVRRGIVEGKAKDRPKTSAGRRLHKLHPAALDALKAQRAVTGLADQHVFLHPGTGRPIANYDHSGKRFDSIQKRAKVRRRPQYQCRHTYCSQMLLAGENPLFVARQMGHKNADMVIRTYGRYIEQGLDSATRRFMDFRLKGANKLEAVR